MSHPGFVLDTSVAIASVLPYEHGHIEADQIMRSLLVMPVIAPSIWILEISSTLLKLARDDTITRYEADAALSLLFQVPVIVVSDDYRGLVLKEVWRVATATGLKLNDASFLYLALVLGIPLATFDKQMRRAATALNLPLLPSAA